MKTSAIDTTSSFSALSVENSVENKKIENILTPFLNQILKTIENSVPVEVFEYTKKKKKSSTADTSWIREIKPCLVELLTNLPQALLDGTLVKSVLLKNQEEQFHERNVKTKNPYLSLEVAQAEFETWQNKLIDELNKDKSKDWHETITVNKLDLEKITDLTIKVLNSSDTLNHPVYPLLNEMAQFCWPQEKQLPLNEISKEIMQVMEKGEPPRSMQELTAAYSTFLSSRTMLSKNKEQAKRYFDYLVNHGFYMEALSFLNDLGAVSTKLSMRDTLVWAEKLIQISSTENIKNYFDDFQSFMYCLIERYKKISIDAVKSVELYSNDTKARNRAELQKGVIDDYKESLKKYIERQFKALCSNPHLIFILNKDNIDLELIENSFSFLDPTWIEELSADLIDVSIETHLNACSDQTSDNDYRSNLTYCANLLLRRCEYEKLIDCQIWNKLHKTFDNYKNWSLTPELKESTQACFGKAWFYTYELIDWQSNENLISELWTTASKNCLKYFLNLDDVLESEEIAQAKQIFEHLIKYSWYEDAINFLHHLGTLSNKLPMKDTLEWAEQLIQISSTESIKNCFYNLKSFIYDLIERHEILLSNAKTLNTPKAEKRAIYKQSQPLKNYLNIQFKTLCSNPHLKYILKGVNFNLNIIKKKLDFLDKSWAEELCCNLIDLSLATHLKAFSKQIKDSTYKINLVHCIDLLLSRSDYNKPLNCQNWDQLNAAFKNFEYRSTYRGSKKTIEALLGKAWFFTCHLIDWKNNEELASSLWAEASKKWLQHYESTHLELLKDDKIFNDLIDSLPVNMRKDNILFYKLARRASEELRVLNPSAEEILNIREKLQKVLKYAPKTMKTSLNTTIETSLKTYLKIYWPILFLLSIKRDPKQLNSCWTEFTTIFTDLNQVHNLSCKGVEKFIETIVVLENVFFFIEEVERFLKVHHQDPNKNSWAFHIGFHILKQLRSHVEKIPPEQKENYEKKLNELEDKVDDLLGEAFKITFSKTSDLPELKYVEYCGMSPFFSFFKAGRQPRATALDTIVSCILTGLQTGLQAGLQINLSDMDSTGLAVFWSSLFWEREKESSNKRLDDCEEIFIKLLTQISDHVNFRFLYERFCNICCLEISYPPYNGKNLYNTPYKTKDSSYIGIASIASKVANKLANIQTSNLTKIRMFFLKLGALFLHIIWNKFKEKDKKYNINLTTLYKLIISYSFNLNRELTKNVAEDDLDSKNIFIKLWLGIIRISNELVEYHIKNTTPIDDKIISTLLRTSCMDLKTLSKQSTLAAVPYWEEMVIFSRALNSYNKEPFPDFQLECILLWLQPFKETSPDRALESFRSLKNLKDKIWNMPADKRNTLHEKSLLFFENYPLYIPLLNDLFTNQQLHPNNL